MTNFCFHYQVHGIRNEVFSNEICSVVALEEIKGHFPAGTTFEDYWPAKGSIEALPNTRASAGAGNWTQKPAERQLSALIHTDKSFSVYSNKIHKWGTGTPFSVLV